MDSMKILRTIEMMKHQLSMLEEQVTGETESEDDSEMGSDMEPDPEDSEEPMEPDEEESDSENTPQKKAKGLAILLLGRKKK